MSCYKFMLFLVLQGLWDTLTFYVLFHRKKKSHLSEYGLSWGDNRKNNLVQIGKCLLLGAIVATTAFTVLYLMERELGLSFTSWWASIRAANLTRIYKSYGYVLLFFFVFLGAQFGSNIVRRLKSSGNDRRDLIRDIVVNCLVSGTMICLLFLFQVVCQNNGVFIKLVDNTSSTHQFYGYSMMILCTQSVNTVLYRKTGTIWPGLIVMTLLFGIMLPANYPINL